MSDQATTSSGPYKGEGVNLSHALHVALQDAEKNDATFKVGKEYELLTTVIETGNSHIHAFRVTIDGI